ncbi:MAG: DUF1049 domain-containing protein [Salinibacterium sp.]|nr:DUF1049 domain-containing protein [Salinibacterium sp.]
MSSDDHGAVRPTTTSPEIDPQTEFPKGTRTGFVWAATIAILVLLTVMIIFILQNQNRAYVHFFGWTGFLPLGVALLIALVAGGALVALGGAARIAQLRRQQRKVAKRITARKPVVGTGKSSTGAPASTKAPEQDAKRGTLPE